MSEELLNRAIALARAGRKQEARELLEPLLEADRQNITAWLWYADTWPDDDQKIRVLELCLKYNPDHPTIQRSLTLLRLRQESSLSRLLTVPTQPAVPTTQEPTKPTESMLSKATATLLDQRVEDYIKAGWQVVYRTPTTAQLKRPKRWNSRCLVISALSLVIGCICSAIDFTLSLGLGLGPFLGALGLLLLLLTVIAYALAEDNLIYLTEEQLREEYRRAEEQRQREEAAKRAEQERIRELKRRKETRKQNKRSKSSAKRIIGLPPGQFRIFAISGSAIFLLVVVIMGLFLLLPSWRSWQAGVIATATARVHNTATAQAAYFLTQSAAPTSTPRPTNTPDLRSPFEKCVQSGQGVRYVITGNGVSGVSLTWTNDTGGTEQGDYKVPACVTYLKFRKGDFLYISAQIIQPTSGAGSIRCRIYQGNNIIAEANAIGFASIATCSGWAR